MYVPNFLKVCLKWFLNLLFYQKKPTVIGDKAVKIILTSRPSMFVTIIVRGASTFALVTNTRLHLLAGLCTLSASQCVYNQGAVLNLSPTITFAPTQCFSFLANFNIQTIFFVTDEFQRYLALVDLEIDFGAVHMEALPVETSFLRFSSLQPDIAYVDGNNYVALSKGYGYYANVNILHTCGPQNNTIFANATGIVDNRLAEPDSALIESPANIMGEPNKALTLLFPNTYPTSISFDIFLIYSQPSVLIKKRKMNGDSRARFSSTNSSVFTVLNQCNTTSCDQRVFAVNAGTAFLSLSFTHTNKTYRISFIVKYATGFTIASNPTPDYPPESSAFSETVLSTIGNTGIYQKASMTYTLQISDGTLSVTLPSSVLGNGVIKMQPVASPASLSFTGADLTLVSVINAPLTLINVTVVVNMLQKVNSNVVLTQQIVYTIDPTPVILVSLTNLRYKTGDTIAGILGKKTNVQLTALMSDSTVWLELFTFSGTTSTAKLPGLVLFSCSTNLDTRAINSNGPVYAIPMICDTTYGTLTLLQNSYKLSSLVANSYDSLVVSNTMSYPTNLMPISKDVVCNIITLLVMAVMIIITRM